MVARYPSSREYCRGLVCVRCLLPCCGCVAVATQGTHVCMFFYELLRLPPLCISYNVPVLAAAA